MAKKYAFLLTTVATLSACGGSSTGSGISNQASFDQLASQGRILIDRYQNAELTPVASMPTAGTASYSGVAAYSDVPDPAYIAANAEIVSTVELNADFSNSSISGQLSNFRTFENQVISGAVGVFNGVIVGSEFQADVSGSLSAAGENVSVDGVMAGGFVTSDASAVVGAIGADLTDSTGTGAIYGVFGAERN